MPLTYLARIAQTPAPTFQEGARAGLIMTLWRELGYDPQQDAAGNVLLRLGPSTEGRALLLASHLDTVFEPHTDVTVREVDGRLVGAGVGDNAASLAVLTAFLRELAPHSGTLSRPLWLAANTAEEGLGDLRGAKALLSEHHADIAAFVAIDGYLGAAVTRAVGVRRYRVTFGGEGGHSWGDQHPSALHGLGLAIAALYSLPLPSKPRTTLNVGVAGGGHSVNSIASHAELLLDLRSLDGKVLQKLDAEVKQVIQAAARQARVQVSLEQVGDRPGGDLRADPLLRLVRQAAVPLGMDIRTTASSTDANAAAPYDFPALALGVYRGGKAHREDEWVQPESLGIGLRLLRGFVSAYMKSGEAVES